jgi:multicomponent K+:H+ antiporter subunit G
MTLASLPVWLELAASLLLLAGGAFALIGAIGLARLGDFHQRLHGPTKASTLGLGGVLIASMLVFGWTGGRVVIHELLITLFVFMTAPIAAHLLVKSSLEREPLRRPPQPGAHAADAPGAAPVSAPAPSPADPDARR